ncbi:MAG: ArsA family ATPase [Deltaproteobacteria bacterium]|nr:ArsA family ATPase [Deltaproteobacteria bacterium]
MSDGYVEALVGSASVLVCVGPGGVGKTTTSAALAIAGARKGRRVIVLTVDPAKRLANALGLPEIGNEEREVDRQAFEAAHLEPPSGRLTAMMLDIKRTWDEVVSRHHPDPERRDRLLSNRFYAALSTSLAGSQEYMAMEKLYELSARTNDRPDLVVLDTPPSANAVDFLDAPTRMLDALDNDATEWLIEPFLQRSKSAGRLLDVGGSIAIRTLGRFTGTETLEELAELLVCFQAMFEGFRERARIVKKILADRGTAFMIVSSPQPGPLAVAKKFEKRLHEERIRVGAFVLNRTTPDPFEGAPRNAELLERRVLELGGSSNLAYRIEWIAREAQASAQAERAVADALTADAGVPVVMVPELDNDVHELRSLDLVRQSLVAGP